MMSITLHEFIYLLPLLILGCAIVVLLFLLFLLRINTKTSAIFTAISLGLALMSSSFIGYKIVSQSENSPMVIYYNHPSSMAIDTEEPNDNEQVIAPVNSNGVVNNQDNIAFQNDETKSLWHPAYVTALFTGDGYGSFYASLVLLVSIIVTTLSFNWFKEEQVNHGLFYLIVLFSTLGGTTLTYSSHLISLFIGIELLSIPIIGLIGYQYTQKYSLEAAIKYMVLSVISTTFLLLGIAFYYAATGELTFSGLSFQLSTFVQPSPLLLLGVCLMLVGIGFKLSLVPFQLWVPDAYQGAPACISLLLTTVGAVAVFCAVARLFLLAPIVNNETIRIIMVIMAFCSIIWGNIFAITQHNIKRLLAYSSISHFGYLLIALIAVQYQVLTLETIGVYLVAYILANICVLGVISLESRSSEKQDQDNDIDLCGLFWRRPIMTLAMGIGLLSLAGVPLTVGFIGRFSLILLGVTAELWWLVGAIVVGSTFGLYFYLRLVIILYLKPNNVQRLVNTIPLQRFGLKKYPGINEIFIVGAALLILLCGVYPKWLFSLVSVAQYLIPQ